MASASARLAVLTFTGYLAVIVVLYGPLLACPFVAEDIASIARAHRLLESGWRAVGEVLLPRSERPDGLFYRPIFDASLLLDYAVWRLDPRGFHASNLLLQAVIVSLLCRLMRQMGASRPTAFLAGLLACLHPCHVEPTGWISARNDLLAAAFLLASLALCRWPPSRARTIAAATCYALSLLSKEWAVIGCLALPALVFASAPGERWCWLRTAAWSIGITAAYFVVRRFVLGTWLTGYEHGPFDPWSLAAWRATASRLTVLLAPLPGDTFALSLRAAVAVAALTLALAAFKRPRIALPAGVFAVLCVGVHWPLEVRTDTLMDARYCYGAALGLCALLAAGASTAGSRRWRMATMAALVGSITAYAFAGNDLRARWRAAARDMPPFLGELQRVANQPQPTRTIVHHVPFTIRGARFMLGAERAALRRPFLVVPAGRRIEVLRQPEASWFLHTLHSLVEETMSGTSIERVAWDPRTLQIVGPWPERGAAPPPAASAPFAEVSLSSGTHVHLTVTGPPGTRVQVLGGTIEAAVAVGATRPLAMRNPVPMRSYELTASGRLDDEFDVPAPISIVQACAIAADGEQLEMSLPWRR